MLKEQRLDVILKEVNSKGVASLKELAKLTQASISSIREDVAELDKQKLLKRVHGGAYSLNNNSSANDVEYESRSNIELDAKIKLATKANEFVQDNLLIFIDSGTTTHQLAKLINNKNVTIVTNSINVATELKSHPNVTTILIGGLLKSNTFNVVGSLALDNLKNFNFDIGFIGANVYSNNLGFTTPEINESLFKKEVISKCKKSYILLDKTKINSEFKYTFATNNKNITLITNYKKKDLNLENIIEV